jgi:hypothetical protein
MNIKTLFLILLGLLPLFSYSQKPGNDSDTLRKDALKVYMEASDFIKKEIPYINYVRDIKEAQVYIISTSERTGSGGLEFTYYLVGQHEFAGMRDTVSYASSPDHTLDQRRHGQVAILKMALMRYIQKTPLAQYFNIGFSVPMSEEVYQDKWNSWVFRTRVNGYLNGQKTYNTTNIFGSITANRTTNEWKINLSLNYSHGRDKFTISDSQILSENRSRSFDALVVKSLGEHWSLGGTTYLGSSTYSNLDLRFRFLPGIEFNFFPYSQSTRKMLKIAWYAGVAYQDYTQVTIYDKSNEWLFGQNIESVYSVVQKWGSANLGANWRNYFHDWNLNNLSLSGMLDFRIAKGLSFNFGGSYTILHDQINLVKGGASAEEILLRRKELETQYSYYTYFGLSYTFGSIYNNVVNPRFRSPGGGMVIMY